MEDWDLNLDEAASTRNAGEAIDRMNRAAILARRDPKRKGNVIELPPRGDLLVTGDIHGCRENFERVVKFADLQRHRDRHLILHELEHGGPEDAGGGCLSYELIEEAAELKAEFPERVHVMLANHDVAEMLNIQLYKGSTNMTQKFWQGLTNVYGTQAEPVKRAYCEFFKSLPLAVRTSNRVWISHSTPHLDALVDFDYTLFDRPLGDDDFRRDSVLYSFLWGRNQDEMAGHLFADHVGCDVLIVGHQPAQIGYKIPNSRHIILYSDNQLGRYLLLPLDKPVTHYELRNHIAKIADLPR